MHIPAAGARFSVLVLLFLSGTSCNQPFTFEMIASGVVFVSNYEFCWPLYKELIQNVGNLVISPLSAQAALTMMWLAANGTTYRELDTALQIPTDTTSRYFMIHGFKYLNIGLKGIPTIPLEMATKLYLQQGFQVNNTFQQEIREYFSSDIKQVDFANKTQDARKSINKWTEEETNHKIQNIIRDGSLTPSTVMVAVNALYFRGGWLKPFNHNLTTTKVFRTTGNSSIRVPMMQQKEYFMFTSNDEIGVKIIRLRYRGKNNNASRWDQETSMIVFLPNNMEDLVHVENYIAEGNILRLLHNMTYREVNVSLPRFTIGQTLNLENSLKQMGVNKLFQTGAELPGITAGNIHLNQLVQKVIVDVSEKGTEDDTATVVEAVPPMASPPEEFNADHPFLFVITQGMSDIILLLGRVMHPQSSSESGTSAT